ncbi:glutaredoxin [Methanohalobium evestigatum Z-7303]|uniref:Glutaredoxin n=1 Tax=Methanohalobium evestigatum (strain ATCC BAA-1072 / DSM 3721 / NBRC 107634 / OCM 161 / Z-7303) TaxID=644295 RepID=D7EAM6_METEZ|nr:glutaredoxin family protein [Methanohalobium evestigatum]ADI75025.1 glutaredoxin [Methanohalobium evestigatum Z-7303]
MEKVFMYTLSTCPWCKKTKKFFEKRKIPYDYVDIDKLKDENEKERIIEEMKREAGSTATPFVIIGDEVIIGYKPKKYAELLGIEE